MPIGKWQFLHPDKKGWFPCHDYMKYTMKLIGSSSISLMNSRSATGYNTTSAYATLGWGTRAVASEDSSTFALANNKNASIYYRRTGKKSVGSQIINLDINELVQLC